ncbi:ATP-binding protein [Pelobium manganitolerans]|uniref:ATP-binding protein n=1 Tax=Pelobium manganitolerans TaxID=1842495 RepID=UPI003FA34BC7
MLKNSPVQTYTPPNLSNCEKEPIHIIGHIQPHGELLAIDATNFEVLYISENLKSKYDIDFKQKISLGDLASENVIDIVKVGLRSGDFATINGTKVDFLNRQMQIIINKQANVCTLEFEPAETLLPENELHLIMGKALARIQSSGSFQDLLWQTVTEIRNITGYDRVMIYQFKQNWDGKVVAEAKRADLESMMDLHFPASDIPAQARQLFKLNQVRIIVDVDANNQPIYNIHENNIPLDLTHSTLRSSSPIHLEYLRNMAVQASLTISIIYKGQLWGMFTCHHYTPKYISYSFRNTCKFIGSLFSSAIEFKQDAREKELLERYYRNESDLVKNVMNGWDILRGLTQFDTKLTDINEAHGAAICFENQFYSVGITPSQTEISEIADRVRDLQADSLYITQHLPKIHPPAKSYAKKACGILMIGLSQSMNDFIIWFKPEQSQTIHWGGNPEKAHEWDGDKQRINPRKSFEKFTTLSQHTSLEWSDNEVAAALKLREDLNSILINKTNEIRALNAELKTAYEYLDTFSYTVSHDLKTPLSSIKGYAEILMRYHRHKIDDDMARSLNQIIVNTDKMKDLIQDVLNYSKIGRVEKELAYVATGNIISELVENIKIGNQDKNINFSMGALPDVQAERTMLYQVFNNLMSNAVKYSKPNVTVDVAIKGIETDHEVTYSVTDNGKGFDMKNADRVFELFKRLDDVNHIEGTGLGLAIVKRIITLHKGKIWVESLPGVGSTFYFSLPKHYYN